MTMALKYIELTTKDNLLLQNNTYHKTLKMKPVNVRSGMYIMVLSIMANTHNLKSVIM